MSKAGLQTKTYELPANVSPQLFAMMAAALGLQVVEQTPTRISVEGREDDQAVFANLLVRLTTRLRR